MPPLHRAFILGSLAAALPAFGVYAPIPEQAKTRDLGFRFEAKGGFAYDSNLFGSASNEVSSNVFTLAPQISFEANPGSKNTYVLASYGLTLDQFDDRPGDKLLDSHELTLRFNHRLSDEMWFDVLDTFSVARNPESLLTGVKVNTDQSYTRNQFDTRGVAPVINGKAQVTAKFRSVYFDYRDAALGRSLDRIENLYGLAGDYKFSKVKGVVEYRHQDVYYTKLGETKNKRSDYLMAGLDHPLTQKLELNARLGAEWRRRAAQADTTAPYAEFSAKYEYNKIAEAKSFLAGGVGYSLEETSDPSRFNDSQVLRTFVNLQHAVTARIVASGSITYEPAELQGRRGQKNIDETGTRGGVALSYLAPKNWTISASYDHDRVRSDDIARKLQRNRIGLSAVYSF